MTLITPSPYCNTSGAKWQLIGYVYRGVYKKMLRVKHYIRKGVEMGGCHHSRSVVVITSCFLSPYITQLVTIPFASSSLVDEVRLPLLGGHLFRRWMCNEYYVKRHHIIDHVVTEVFKE